MSSPTVVADSATQEEAWTARVVPEIERLDPGVWIVPVPYPGSPIRFTYCYLLMSGDDLIVVDPGKYSVGGWRQLVSAFDTAGRQLGMVTGIVVTHFHEDHWSMAAKVSQESEAWVAMGAREHQWISRLTPDVVSVGAATRRLRRWGVPENVIDDIARTDDYWQCLTSAAPTRILRDGENIVVGGRRIEVVTTPGHTPGHICLRDKDAGLLFSGDHLLPGITSNVSLNPFGLADPLGSYLDSLEKVSAFDDDLVLPAHEFRFRGARARACEIREECRLRLDEVHNALNGGNRTVWQVATQLTWSRPWTSFSALSQRMALGETASYLAHVTSNRRSSR